MIKGLIGRKIGMTQMFDAETGLAHAVTVLEVGPCPVVQVKTKDNDGYEAVQVGFGKARKKNTAKQQLKRFEKLSLEPARVTKEFAPAAAGKLPQPAQVLDVSIFDGVKTVKVSGTSKGRGFQGVHHRHGMAGGPKTHGSTFHRRVGSVGCRATPAKTHKGKRMPGHMGNERVSVLNLTVHRIDKEKNLLYVRGCVPGHNTAIVYVYAGGR